MHRNHSHTRRGGFTLTEMLVASALIIFMMWILSSAFEKGLTTFSQLKTAGDMQEKLRAATTIIRQDLISQHFDGGDPQHFANDSEFVSGQRMNHTDWKPPAQGFFRIFQEGASIPEGLDPDDPTQTLVHTRSPANVNSRGHMMQFTVKQKGDRRDRYFMIDPQDLGEGPGGEGRLHFLSEPSYNNRRRQSVTLPGGGTLPAEAISSVFSTTWAEITYFVRPNGATTGGVPLYSLYRRQNLLATELGTAVNVQVPANDPRYIEVSAWSTTNPNRPVNSQKTITAPSRRFAVDPTAIATSVRAGRYKDQIPRLQDEAAVTQAMVASDLLLTDITDFEIKVMWDSAPGSGAMPAPTPQPLGNPDFPFDRLPTGNNPFLTGSRVFDTWSRNRSSAGSNMDDYGTTLAVVTPPTEPWNRGYVTTVPPQDANEQTIPVKIRVRAIQIELRIWDVKSKQSRQITIIQDL